MFNPLDLIRAKSFKPEGDPRNHENVARQLASLCLLEADRVLYKPKPGGIYAQRHLNHYTHLLMERVLLMEDPDKLLWSSIDPAALDWHYTGWVTNEATLSMAQRIIDKPLNPDPHS